VNDAMHRLICSAASVLAISTAAHAQVGPPTVGAPPVTAAAAVAEAPASAEYILGPEDVIEVSVVGQPQPSRARIYTDGSVQLDLVGRMTAAGRTPREFSLEVSKALQTGGFYANPVVNIEVVSYASRYVTVLGAVGQPGLVPMNRAYRLSEILARVGGVKEGAAEYLVVRPEKGPEARYDIEKLASGAADMDPVISPGDKIFSPVADVFYISGAVNTPGVYSLKGGMTVGQAISRGGGLNESGSGKRVKVTRAGKKLKLDSDAKLEPNDVLTVSERLF